MNNVRVACKIWDACVRSVLMCGVEVCGTRGYECIEREQMWFLKRMLGVERSTPSYIVLQETNGERLECDVMVRVVRYEMRVWELEEERLVKAVWVESVCGGEERWRSERRKMYERVGLSEVEVMEWLGNGVKMDEWVKGKVKEVEGQERQGCIERNEFYGSIWDVAGVWKSTWMFDREGMEWRGLGDSGKGEVWIG